MSNKIKKIIFTIASALAVAGMGISVYARTVGLEATVKRKVFSGSFEYYQPGHNLRIEADYTKYDAQNDIRKTDTVTNTAFGSSTGVTCSQNAGTDCEFLVVRFLAKVDGVIQAMSPNMYPED